MLMVIYNSRFCKYSRILHFKIHVKMSTSLTEKENFFFHGEITQIIKEFYFSNKYIAVCMYGLIYFYFVSVSKKD